MKPGSLGKRIERAKELLRDIRHAALATVNKDGSPLNSPLFVAFDDQLNFCWASHPGTHHSQNVTRDGRVFLVLFDSVGKGGGLYVAAQASEVAESGLEKAAQVFNARRAQLGREALPPSHFIGDNSQRLYCGRPTEMWVNITETDTQGRIIKEHRHQVTAADILSAR